LERFTHPPGLVYNWGDVFSRGGPRLNQTPATTVVSFDMDGTLTGGRFTELVWGEGIPSLYSLAHGVPLDRARDYVFGRYAAVGDKRTEWYDIKYWFRLFGLGESWQELLDSYRHEIRVFSEVHRVLDALRQRYTLIVTSNASREFTDIELGSTGLRPYFSEVFSATSDFSQVKKTPEVYLRVCRMVDAEPSQLAHVGDHRAFDHDVPRELGIRAFYLDRTGTESGESVLQNLNQFVERLRLTG
jgi:putative hydrolase of the HAD superfamily